MRVKAPNGTILDVPASIASGLIGSPNQPGWFYVADDAVADSGSVAPKPYASKADWVTYAVARGVPRAEADTFSKNDLIKRLS